MTDQSPEQPSRPQLKREAVMPVGKELPDAPGVWWQGRTPVIVTKDDYSPVLAATFGSGVRIRVDGLTPGGWLPASAPLGESEQFDREDKIRHEIVQRLTTEAYDIVFAGEPEAEREVRWKWVVLEIRKLKAELSQARAEAAEAKAKAKSFDEIWKVCIELGMHIHPPGDDEDGVYQPEEYAYQFGFIRGLKERAEDAEAERDRLRESLQAWLPVIEAGVENEKLRTMLGVPLAPQGGEKTT